ncbi:Calpain-like cysteine protease C2 [Phytophthora megakarya]|uniref:Calpain-like cysteine protease C2 n=1 Tax=Phytophthora megakarya TaxID=4795 RepID=A0A225WJ72_9STRA|nr:Calpain-like cysteine protease C2 [Phytophthora megakarya]
MPHRSLTIDSSALAVEDEIIQWLSTQADEAGSVPLYEDPDFSSEVSSLYFDPSKLPDYVSQQNGEAAGHYFWYRPTEYAADPDYFKSSTGCGVLREGMINDVWLLGVFAAVALHPDNLVENLFVSESLHNFKQFGVYTCRFFKDDNWVPITTDTRIPYSLELQPEDKVVSGVTSFTPPGAALYGGSVDKNEVFIPFLEKAYAKLHGSYQTLDEKYGGGFGGSAGTSSGRILEAFLDCTGGSAHRVDLQLERVKQLQFSQATTGNKSTVASNPSMILWKQILRYKRKKCILTTQLRQLSFNAHDVTAMGIVKNRQYIIQHVTEVGLPSTGGSNGQQNPEEVLRFVKLKTVWGRGMWKGEWSNDDSKWEEHTQVEQAMRSDPRCEFSRSGHDGCFWMVWEDLLDTFTELFVVHVFQPDDRQYSVRGEWVGTTAAGAPEILIQKTRWGWLHDADPNWHRNPQFKLTVPLESLKTGKAEKIADKSVNGVLVTLTQRDFRLYGGDNYAINFVLLREKLTLATAASNDPPPAIWEFKRSHVVAEAHSYETSLSGIDWSGATPATPASPGLSHPATPMTGGVANVNGNGGAQSKTLPERELVKEDITISPGAAYYLVPYTTNPKVDMEFFLRVVAHHPIRVERVPPIMSVIRTGRWRADDGGTSHNDTNGAPAGGTSSTGEMANAGGPLLSLPLPQTHVVGDENPAWCQNPQFWVRFAERSPKELRRLRKLLSTKAHVTIKVILRKTSHRASLGTKSRQQREAAKDRANLVGITVVRATPTIATPPVIVGGSGSSAATQLRAHTKSQKTNFLGEIVDSPYAKATAISENSIRGTKVRNNPKVEKITDELDDDGEAPEQAEPGSITANFPSPKLVVKPTEWCRLSSYSSPASACLYLRKVPKDWLLASDSPSAVNSNGGGGLFLVPTLGEAGAEGSFELQVDCDFPLLVDELPKGAGAVQSMPGEWSATKSGGCHLHPDWRQNPKFYLQIQGVRPTKVRITLTRSEREWKSRCQRDSVGTMIGFYLFRGGSGKLIRPGDSTEGGSNSANPIVINGRPWSETDFVPLHSICSPPDLILSAAAKDGYVIVPTTYEPGRLGKFVISVQCDIEFTLTCDSE